MRLHHYVRIPLTGTCITAGEKDHRQQYLAIHKLHFRTRCPLLDILVKQGFRRLPFYKNQDVPNSNLSCRRAGTSPLSQLSSVPSIIGLRYFWINKSYLPCAWIIAEAMVSWPVSSLFITSMTAIYQNCLQYPCN